MSRIIQQSDPTSTAHGAKTLAIMQPYFLPYIGYWQMMQAVDEFIIYDDVQFSKGGWINRNRLLLDGAAHTFSLPLRKGNLGDKINERYLCDAWPDARTSLQAKFAHAYSKAPQYARVMPIIEEVMSAPHLNLADFLCVGLERVKTYLGIDTPLLRSSELAAGQGLRASDRVLAMCEARAASTYVNAPGGRELYDREDFKSRGITLHFIQTDNIAYEQFSETFLPSLSILDVMMFNDQGTIKTLLSRYRLD